MESWPWGELICKLSETAKDISIGVSVFTLVALSGDRYFAIVDPLKKLHATGEFDVFSGNGFITVTFIKGTKLFLNFHVGRS